jgi:Ca2+/Na+ antiporter
VLEKKNDRNVGFAVLVLMVFVGVLYDRRQELLEFIVASSFVVTFIILLFLLCKIIGMTVRKVDNLICRRSESRGDRGPHR